MSKLVYNTSILTNWSHPMKLKLAAISIAIILSGCASTKTEGEGPVKTQKLSTSFAGEKIKIETNCLGISHGKVIAKLFQLNQPQPQHLLVILQTIVKQH